MVLFKPRYLLLRSSGRLRNALLPKLCGSEFPLSGLLSLSSRFRIRSFLGNT